MTRFTRDVLPRLASVRSQVIHNDYHLYNVLVAPDDQALSSAPIRPLRFLRSFMVVSVR